MKRGPRWLRHAMIGLVGLIAFVAVLWSLLSVLVWFLSDDLSFVLLLLDLSAPLTVILAVVLLGLLAFFGADWRAWVVTGPSTAAIVLLLVFPHEVYMAGARTYFHVRRNGLDREVTL